MAGNGQVRHQEKQQPFDQPSPSPFPTPTDGRPYRSHKIPACERCRKRKLRCAIDVPSQPCHLCHSAGAICIQVPREERPPLSARRRATAVAAVQSQTSDREGSAPVNHTNDPEKCCPTSDYHAPEGPRDHDLNPALAPPLLIQKQIVNQDSHVPVIPALAPGNADTVGSRSSMIVGPVMAEHVQMIENYMSSQGRLRRPTKDRLYDTVSDNPQDPILYLTVPRRRQGLPLNSRPGEQQREILEHILGPHIDQLISVYFEYIHPSFPIIDEEHFIQLYKTSDRGLSAALVCEVLASSLIYWHRCAALRPFPCPDLRYAWNLAVVALQEEFLAPGMSTIHAALLDLAGRPTTSITGNTINSGRTVALAHVLGLNRDSQTWSISEAEKNMRIRLWWGVLIHDRWSSFAHGVPTQITKDQYEVPIPTISVLITAGVATIARIEAAECFIALCTLTEVIGDILPLVYDRRKRSRPEILKILRRLETNLDDWEESEIVVKSLSDRRDRPGSSSLKLGFLSAKMMICRIAFRSATPLEEPGSLEVRQYSQTMLRESAQVIISFMCTLTSHNLCEFWLPYAAYHLASATIILLRCGIETNDVITAESCKKSLTSFMCWLRRAKEQDQWDLADICLAQCEGPIMQIYGSQGNSSHSFGQGALNSMAHHENDGEPYSSDIFSSDEWRKGVHIGPSVTDTQNNVHGFEYPWADLWDMFGTQTT